MLLTPNTFHQTKTCVNVRELTPYMQKCTEKFLVTTIFSEKSVPQKIKRPKLVELEWEKPFLFIDLLYRFIF